MRWKVWSSAVVVGVLALSACGGGGGKGSSDDDMEGGGAEPTPVPSPPPVTVTFESYCPSETVTVYETDPSGSTCTLVDTSGPVTPAVSSPNAYSASTTGAADCSGGTRVEITPGSDGDVSFDISTNAGTTGPVFFNVPVQFLALQSTAPSPCVLPIWDGGTGPADLRGVSSQVCDVATCATAYQTPTSGPQFITRDTAASSYVVEWCPDQNPSPIPVCAPPAFEESAPCPNVCWEDAVTQPSPCAQQNKVMCDKDPFGGTRPESYCLLPTDCATYGTPCGCCTSDADCSGGQTCTNFLCS